MTEEKIFETLQALEELGIPSSPIGILRALSLGILKHTEYRSIMEWAHKRGLPRDWFRVLVSSAV